MTNRASDTVCNLIGDFRQYVQGDSEHSLHDSETMFRMVAKKAKAR
jgi:hypothetical protein